MNHIRVHYAPNTGRILAWDNAPGGDALFGGAIAVFEIPEGHEIKIDPTAHRIDLGTLDLEDMSDHEIAAARGPQDWQLKQAVAAELNNTDGMMAPDRHVPKRDAWAAYRRALRDVSKPQYENDPTRRPTPVEMVAAFPLRPDGTDAAVLLRARPTQG